MEELYCPNCGARLENNQVFCSICITNVRCIKRETMITSYINMWKRAFDFKGRARRSEYWLACLANSIIAVFLALLSRIVSFIGVVGLIYLIAIIIPGLSLAVRRLHDTNRSGHWLWLILTVYGSIALLVFYFQDKVQPYNKYGKSSKWYSIHDLTGGETEDVV